MDLKLALVILAVVITQVCGYSLDGIYPRFNRRASTEGKVFSFATSSNDGKGSTSVVMGSLPAHFGVFPLRMSKRVVKNPLRFLDDKASRRSYLRFDGGYDPFMFSRRA